MHNNSFFVKWKGQTEQCMSRYFTIAPLGSQLISLSSSKLKHIHSHFDRRLNKLEALCMHTNCNKKKKWIKPQKSEPTLQSQQGVWSVLEGEIWCRSKWMSTCGIGTQVQERKLVVDFWKSQFRLKSFSSKYILNVYNVSARAQQINRALQPMLWFSLSAYTNTYLHTFVHTPVGNCTLMCARIHTHSQTIPNQRDKTANQPGDRERKEDRMDEWMNEQTTHKM